MQITSSVAISKIISLFFILSTILLLGNIALAQPAEKTIAGNWLGTLEINAIKLRLGLKIVAKDDGSFTATFDSIDQGAKDLAIDKITYQEGAVNFEAKQFGITFTGKLENGEIVGEFKQGQGKFPLTFKRQDAPVTLNRPQHPKTPYPYEEQEVSYENKKDAIKLAGTLSLPKASKAPFAAVILITGSGPQNRDEEIFGHKPFLVLSDYLTRQGIAVLRVDDRGVGGSSKNVATETSENYAEDVLAGVEFLKTHKSINPKQIGLIGHSEGGIIAPMVATKSTDIAFIVLLAGPGLTGSEIIKLQGALIAKAGGASDQAIASSQELQEISFQILKAEKDDVIAKKKLVEESKKFYAKFSKEEKQALGIPADITDAQIESSLGRFVSSWFRFFLEYDPRPTLKNVKCPVLAVNGEKDLQVPYQENLSEIEKALKEAKNKDFQIKSFPNLNHLFQTAKTGSPTEYGSIEETFAPVALKEVGDWILARVSVNK
ncbi:MAG: alpha/beta fold hydrolase [Blastocatellia bacterium]|nr:alpha/beta fold hydrolase [Blastocatellia bacterium]MBL8194256.1 alpha/beta fold hydrolase [Blastocatellia bacterium]MBN8723610.1 alpha/beta fold hydrolase [Acidobacteriota bacterium]